MKAGLDRLRVIGEPRRVAHPSCDVLLLVFCATPGDCDAIASRSGADLGLLRRHLPQCHGVPPLHTVSAFATTARLVLGREAVPCLTAEVDGEATMRDGWPRGGHAGSGSIQFDEIVRKTSSNDSALICRERK